MRFLKLFFVLSLLLSACTHDFSSNNENTNTSNKKNTNSSYDKDMLPVAKEQEGFSLGLYDSNKIEPKRTFFTKKDNFSKNIVFGNKTSKEGNFLLIIFNHGEQLPYHVNNKKYINYKFTLKPGEFADIPITIKELNKGFHSVNYIIIRDPDLIQDDFGKALRLSQLYSIRVNILRDINEIPDKRPNLFSKTVSNNQNKVHGVFINKENEDYTAWFKEEVTKENRNIVDYSIIYGNKEKKNMNFYIVSLLNWEQIKINNNLYIYDHLEPDQAKKIKANLKIQKFNKNDNIFVVLLLPDPYIELPDENPYSLFSPFSSLRTKIKIND
ncbi:hypothetical protein [Bacillus canaveralius]|uniref:hypothetical protein n=1 Tax=Bacillus canaveralius TaxID=1403243 RepID=UPI000F790AF4|nr:hypothetical protein [Bacillus canaveralius]RSK44887.1 hypothetical protein EJA13_20515 [Bacillus canaveralius]